MLFLAFPDPVILSVAVRFLKKGVHAAGATISVSPKSDPVTTPEFDNIEAHVGMWRRKFQACLSSIVCLYVLKATDNPVLVGDTNVLQE